MKPLVREVKQYQATDGTCFSTREEAESYEEMLQNPHFKKLQERVENLEKDILTIKADIATLHREPARASWPIGPQAMLNGKDRVPLSQVGEASMAYFGKEGA